MTADGDLLPPHLERQRLLAWTGFCFSLPPRWEVTGYLLAAVAGRLQFHREVQECGELSWRAVEGTPDLPRMARGTLVAIEDKMGAPSGAQAASVTAVGEWVVATASSGRVVAILWQSARARILQWVFTSNRGEATAADIGRLLLSFSPNSEVPRRWRLFGAGCRLPDDYAFERVAALPGHVAMLFLAPNHARVAVRRIALVSEVLGEAGGMIGLYRKLLRLDGQRLLEIVEEPLGGRPAVRAEFESPGQKGLEKLMGSWWKGRGWLWHDQLEDRLYSIEQVGPSGWQQLEPSHVID